MLKDGGGGDLGPGCVVRGDAVSNKIMYEIILCCSISCSIILHDIVHYNILYNIT